MSRQAWCYACQASEVGFKASRKASELTLTSATQTVYRLLVSLIHTWEDRRKLVVRIDCSIDFQLVRQGWATMSLSSRKGRTMLRLCLRSELKG